MRRVVSLFSAVAATLGASIVGSPPAYPASYSVSFSGTVVCDSSADGVQGVWVNNYDGSDGFAKWWAYPGKLNGARFSIKVTATRKDPKIRLDIGCGGTASRWRRTLLTPDFRTKNGFTENRRCVGTAKAANRAVVCKPSPQAKTTSANQGIEGYCTWGAYEKWKAWTGRGDYPDIGGHAKQMDDNAKAKGFYVGSVPHVGSMVVFNDAAYDPWGHVGWVTAVRLTDKKVYFDYIDMNGGTVWVDQANGITDKFNVFDQKTNRKWASTQAFIVAPS